MSKKLQMAGTLSLAATFLFAVLSSDGSAAAVRAQTLNPAQVSFSAPTDGPQQAAPSSEAASQQDDADLAVEGDVASLDQLVARQSAVTAPLSRELNCLASAIYFEAKSEPLAGQLAVGRVIVARSRSGRFPDSYCGVVYQPSQFSFIHGASMPAINKDSRYWKNAVALAQIAHDGSWQSPVEGALYFHAARVSPNWRAARMAKVGNHVFYR